MPCTLTDDDDGTWSAPTGSAITVGIRASNTRLTNIEYNGSAQRVDDDKTSTVTVAAGFANIVMVMAAVQEDITIVEICTDGATQEIDSFVNRKLTTYAFTVEGK